MLPVIFQYVFKEHGVDTLTYSYIMSAGGIFQLIMSPVIGRFGDTFGSRSVLLLTAFSSAIGLLSMGLAVGFYSLVIARFIYVAQDVGIGIIHITLSENDKY